MTVINNPFFRKEHPEPTLSWLGMQITIPYYMNSRTSGTICLAVPATFKDSNFFLPNHWYKP